MNSFIQNVNYVASLDNNYGDQAYLLKNNLTLMNTANDIVLSFKYFDFNERIIKEISHSKTGVLYSGLELVLQEFVNKINSTMGIKATATYQLLNLTIGFSITIASNVSDIKVNELNFNAKKTQDQVELYNLYGEIRNTLKILPTLAMLDKSILDGFSIAGKNIDDIVNVSNNIEDVITVSNNIENVNTASQNIEYINNVSTNINNVNAVGSSIDNVNIVGENIENVNIVAENIESVNNVSNNIEAIKPITLNMDAVINVHNNMNSVVTDANNIGNINIVADDLSETGFSNLIDMGSIADPVEQEPTGISLIETVAVNINDVRTVGSNISDTIVVSENIEDVKTVAINIENINKAGTSIDNINIVAPHVNNIDTVANNIVVVNTVSENIVDIQNAEENAQIAIDKAAEALASENMAHKWAQNPEDEIVRGTFGVDDEYSAYHWSKKAEAIAGGNISLNSLYDVDTTGILDGGLIKFNESTGVWEAYDFAHNDVIGFDLNSGTSVSEGQLAWNNTEKTLDLGLSGGSTLQLGHESVRLVRNNTASTINDGTLVMFDGTIGNSGRVKVKPFTGGFKEAMYCYGIATQNILAGADGIITTEGKVREIDTTGTSVGEVWNDGDVLYAKPNDNGRMTNVVPVDSELKMPVAIVIKAHTNGTLEIRFTPINENIYYTKEQNDILLSNKVPLNGDFILDLGGI